ncbi:glutathione-disulfide reductase [Pararhodobacter sp.]|uniref:glutathione-disulfide reductase n=1 Tax=Pararhodobacter sp. TaxID=2127056 RepID=UPI002FDDA749
MTFDYDLFVIGGGSGGVRAARIAASEGGARVAMAEEYRMGGTCVIRGCVPKKLMVFAAGHGATLEEARAYGWQVEATGFDWRAFRAKLDAELTRLEGAYTRNAENAGVEIFHQRATLADPHTVLLADGRRLTARHILIATGGTPFVPPEFDGQGAMTSNEVFLMDELPGTMLIIGGGFIACEFACVLQGLGVAVTQMYRGAQILRGFDDDLRHTVAAEMGAQGVTLEVGTDLVSLERLPDGRYAASDTNGGRREFDRVLFATGRVANTGGLGLEAAGVALQENGAVKVDGWSQTNIPSIYAVGDVTDRIQLTPVAIREGHAFADTVFGGKPTQADHALVASAVFTRPEAATVGLTEEEARREGPVKIFMTSFRPMQTAFAGGTSKVMMKLVVCAASDRVLGCHIVAPGAAEMIQFAAVALKMGATKADFDRVVAVHPTMAEEIVLLRKPVREG